MFRAALLGIVQGLTEFIPVSSSGHLIIISRLLGWTDLGLSFDVALHMGTLVALLIFFRKDWLRLLKGLVSSLRRKPSRWDFQERLAWYIIVGTIPAALAGYFLEKYARDTFRALWVVALTLLLGSLVLVAAERWGSMKREFSKVELADAGGVGLSQAVALFPGVSRSGITISTGMLLGMKREAAARFSFLLATPIVGGAGVYEMTKLAGEGMPGSMVKVFAVGFLTSGLVGFFTIKYLLRYLESRSMYPFVWYRLALVVLIIVYLAIQ